MEECLRHSQQEAPHRAEARGKAGGLRAGHVVQGHTKGMGPVRSIWVAAKWQLLEKSDPWVPNMPSWQGR